MLLKIFKNRTVSSSGTWGTKNENNYEILNFEFPEELEEYNKRIVYYLGNQKVWDPIIDNKAILTNAITTKGSVKAYIWCTKSDEAFETDVDFRTQIFVMNFFENENADGIVPTPEQVDGFNTMLTAMNEKIEEIDELETTIENAETQRQENEETRQENESTRQDNEQTRQEQEAERERRTNEAIGNIEDKTAEYNQNAEEKTNEFNDLVETQKLVIENYADTQLNAIGKKGKQALSSITTTTQYALQNISLAQQTGVSAVETASSEAITDFNTNATNKTNAFNSNATEKTTEFNTNVESKTSAFNDNATQKTTNFDNNASEKTDEFNTNAQNKINEYDEHIVEYQAQIDELQEEVEELSENMPWNETEQDTSIDITDGAKYSKNKIKVFGNTEQASYSGKNLWGGYTRDVSTLGISYSYIGDGSISIVGTATGNAYSTTVADAIANNRYNNVPAGTYTISKDSSNYDVTIYDTNSNNIVNLNGDTMTATITLTEITGIIMRIRVNNGTTIDTIAHIQIEQGSTATEWERYTNGPSPNPDYPQPIHVVTGNNTVEVQGKNLIPGEVFEFCTITDTGGKNQDPTRICTDFIELDPAKQYFLSTSINYGFLGIAFYDNTYTYISRLYWNRSKRHTIATTDIPNNTKYAKVFGQIASNVITSTSEFEKNEWYLEEGDSNNTKYVPYYHADYPINLGPLELCKIGNYQDYLYKENGNWYKYGAIDKYIFSGTETYYLLERTGVNVLQQRSVINNKVNKTRSMINIISSHFVGIKDNDGDIPETIRVDGSGQVDFTITNTNPISVSTDAFKTWLNSHNVTSYYLLATPTSTQITDETLIAQLEAIYNKIALVKGTNHITITPSDLEPYMKLNYMQDLPSKLDNLDSRLSLLE